jgi:Domain of unknown function (DUF4430)
MKPLRIFLSATVAALVLAGCGLGAGSKPSAVSLLVTSGFGARVLNASGSLKVEGQETAMSLLQRNYNVRTSDGGGFVQSVDGVAGGHEAGQPVDWFYYVNGVEATRGADATNVRSGDRIWWDRHDWSQAEGVPAVVGSFPEPFLHGIDGKRLAVHVECAAVAGYACRTVAARLRALGVSLTTGSILSKADPSALRVLVAPWASISGLLGAQSLEQAPRASGVYARFSAGGGELSLLDEEGHTAARLSTGAGLIAATRRGEDAPAWLVTGTDGQGVERAVRAFERHTLEDRFAVALSAAGTISLPDEGHSR